MYLQYLLFSLLSRNKVIELIKIKKPIENLSASFTKKPHLVLFPSNLAIVLLKKKINYAYLFNH